MKPVEPAGSVFFTGFKNRTGGFFWDVGRFEPVEKMTGFEPGRFAGADL